MKTLSKIEGINFITEFTPISDDWFIFRRKSKEFSFIHEKCYYEFYIKKNKFLWSFFIANMSFKENKCIICSEEPPKNLLNFVTIANSLNKLGGEDGE